MTTIRQATALRTHTLLSAAVLLGFTALLVVLWGHNPAASSLFPPCPFRAATGGLLCPGCGTLRGLHALLHGHLGQALALNALMVLSLPLFGYLAVASLRSRLRPARRRAGAWPHQLAWVVLAVVGTWSVARNLF